jgi:ABC-2 type transport system ATP-binding protein
MDAILSVNSVSKTYKNSFKALNNISLEIPKGEIFALLGPNGAGKTTLISTICGIIRQSNGHIKVKGLDTIRNWRQTRQLIGLVPQELTLDNFETVWDAVLFSRGLFGKSPDKDYLEWILNSLSLYEKKDESIIRLSGGMKRRVLIAKALSHNPELIFLDEPTAGVDVSLRKSMWNLVQELRQTGATVILTTHYIEEAEEIADRIGIIDNGKLLLVEDKNTLMTKMGKRQLIVYVKKKIKIIPKLLSKFKLQIHDTGDAVIYTYDKHANRTGITRMLNALYENNIIVKDLQTHQSSLEEVFLSFINKGSK